jgi:hypothetical protein
VRCEREEMIMKEDITYREREREGEGKKILLKLRD